MSRNADPIDIRMIWVDEAHGGEAAPWLHEAWDELSIDGNPDGWAGALKAARATYEEVRVVSTRIDYEDVQNLFPIPHIENTGTKENN